MNLFSKYCGVIAFCFLLVALIIGPVFFGAVHTSYASLVQMLVLAGFSAVLLRSMILARSILRDPLDMAILICWIYLTIRYVTSPHEFQSRQEWLMASAAFWVYFSVRSLRSQRWIVPALGVALLLVACGISIYALYQRFSGSLDVLWLKSSYPGRVSGTYYCPNHLAGFLEFFIPLLLALVLFTRISIGRRLLVAYALVLLTTAHLFTFSRGGLLSLSAGCALVFLLGWRHKGAALLILAIVGILGAFVLAHYLKSSNVVEYQRYSTVVHGEWSRVEMWKSALALWKEAPWFGLGPMQFDWWHASVRGNVPARAVYVHNDYLQLLAEYGVVGMVLFLAFLILALAKLFSVTRNLELLRNTFHHPHIVLGPEEGWRRAAFIGVAGSLSTLFLHSVVDFNMHIQANALLFALAMAAGHNMADQGELPREAGRLERAIRRLMAAALLGVVAWQGWAIWVTYHGDRWLRDAEIRRQAMDWTGAGESYGHALAADPQNSEAWARQASFLYQRALLDVVNKRSYERQFLSVSEKALALNPLNKILRIRRGEILDRMKNFSEAEKEYLDAITFDPTNGYYRNRLGLHYKRWGKKAKAKAAFEQAAKLPGGKLTADVNLRILGPIKGPGAGE